MELSIIKAEDGGLIIQDFETIKTELAEALKTYKTMVFTADDIKAAKEYRAQLNKTSAALKESFAEKKKELFAQLYTLESQTKELVDIVGDCAGTIDAQIKAFEAEEKAAKLAECTAIFEEEFAGLEWVCFEQIQNERWTNKTFTLAKVAEEMKAKREEIEANLDTLERLDAFSFEAIEEYKRTLDINRAIAEGQRQADIQRRKEEARRLAEEEAARKAAEAAATTPTTPAEAPEEVKTENGANMSEETHTLIMTVDGKGFRAIITEEQKAELNRVIKDYITRCGVKMERIGG
jgi:hypothetical protein